MSSRQFLQCSFLGNGAKYDKSYDFSLLGNCILVQNLLSKRERSHQCIVFVMGPSGQDIYARCDLFFYFIKLVRTLNIK